MTEKTIHLTLAYDGGPYCGWQRQPNGVSVEEKLRGALAALGVSYTRLRASGRTDAGVHALGQSVSFLTESSVPPERYAPALNTHLPPDIRVMASREAARDFDAHTSARGKHYRYRVDLGGVHTPFESGRSWHYPHVLDMARVQRACAYLSGRHDYAAFMAAGSSVKTTARDVWKIMPALDGRILTLDVYGGGFLYNMVRILVGTIVGYASGQYPEEKLVRVFKEPVRANAGITAPACGLYLMEVYYDAGEKNGEC